MEGNASDTLETIPAQFLLCQLLKSLRIMADVCRGKQHVANSLPCMSATFGVWRSRLLFSFAKCIFPMYYSSKLVCGEGETKRQNHIFTHACAATCKLEAYHKKIILLYKLIFVNLCIFRHVVCPKLYKFPSGGPFHLLSFLDICFCEGGDEHGGKWATVHLTLWTR